MDVDWTRKLFEFVDEAYVYEPNPVIAERDAVIHFAALYAGWTEDP